MHTNRGWWIPAEDGGPEREYVWPYINRELGLRLYYGGSQHKIQTKRISECGTALIFIDSSVKDFQFLKKFPKKSVDVFLVSDETYSFISTARLLLLNSTRSIYRDYPVHSFVNFVHWPITTLRLAFKSVQNNLGIILYLKALLAGLVLAGKQFLISLTKSITGKHLGHLPLGYTGGFEDLFVKSNHLNDKESLIKYALANQEKIRREKKLQVFFTGQIGKFDRQLMLAEALKVNLNLGPIHESFGGPKEQLAKQYAIRNYFEGLKESYFSFCPPGNYSPETFRYIESLLLFSFPLQPKRVISNPLYSSPNGNTWQEFCRATVKGSLDSFYDSQKILGALECTLSNIRKVSIEVGIIEENS